ncbi:MAG: hypothetical protein JNM07_13900 [Phycisphaerae bacterium]|nr:hypothetical protein [Phycisphaerae bacterium]
MRTEHALVAVAALVIGSHFASGQVTIYQGDAATEAAWRSAAAGIGGTVPLENFESYLGTPGPCQNRTDPVVALPALGVVLHGVVSGSYPGCYDDVMFAHSGAKQLANFGYDVPCANAVDYFIAASPGRVIRCAGLWQCDPQGNLTIVAEDASGSPMFTFVALINNQSGNSFGGFVSSLPVARLRVLGAEGDGWNHLDDLQIVTLCAADFNGDTSVDDFDFFDFLNAFNANDISADFNADTSVDDFDYFDFLNAFFGGC